MIFCDQPGQDSQKNEKEDGPNKNGIAFEKLNVFVIVALYVHEELSSCDLDSGDLGSAPKKRYATGSSIICLRFPLSTLFCMSNSTESNGLLRNNLL
jgi:hypothetical protein